jgi:hypothetical protein
MCVTSGAKVRRASYTVKTSEATEVGAERLQLFKGIKEVTYLNVRRERLTRAAATAISSAPRACCGSLDKLCRRDGILLKQRFW